MISVKYDDASMIAFSHHAAAHFQSHDAAATSRVSPAPRSPNGVYDTTDARAFVHILFFSLGVKCWLAPCPASPSVFLFYHYRRDVPICFTRISRYSYTARFYCHAPALPSTTARALA